MTAKWIALDPGGTTGVCLYMPKEIIIKTVELEPEHYVHLWNILNSVEPEHVICERFDYRGYQQNVDLTAVEYIGITELYCRLNRVPLEYQQQLKGHKGLWTNDKLKTLDLYEPGKPHAMDALRHMLYFITINKGDSYWVRRLRDERER